MKYLQDPDVTLYNGDCLEVLRTLPDRSVHMCATSPPFYGLRDYGTGTWEGGDEGCDHIQEAARSEESLTHSTLGPKREGLGAENAAHKAQAKSYGSLCRKCGAVRTDRQIGLEESPDEWVARLVEVFREVRRVLRDDGTLWVEIGDSYASQGGPQVPQTKQHVGSGYDGPNRHLNGQKPKDLLGQPWLLAQALRDPYYTGKIKREVDRVWLAAMVDGEGSIGIHKRPAGTSNYAPYTRKDGTVANYERKNDSYQPKLEITNTNLAIIERVIALTGEGNTKVKQEAGTHGRKQTIYRWTVTADKCRDLLRELYPHLVGKCHEARLAYGCPSSGDKAQKAHEALKLLHGGEEPTGIDFPAPESLFEAGWFLRSEIIWARLHPNPMPESVTDRPTKAHSTVFLLSKMPRYYFDAEAIREPHNGAVTGGRSVRVYDAEHFKSTDERNTRFQGPTENGANARSVWTIDYDKEAWTGADDTEWIGRFGSCRKCGGLRVAGNGSALTTETATDASGHQESEPLTDPPTNSSLAPSLLDSPSTISARTRDASTPPTSNPSRSESTSSEATPRPLATEPRPTALRDTNTQLRTLIDALTEAGSAVCVCETEHDANAPQSVWRVATEPTPFAHFATWPQRLVSRMILAGTSERGVCPECGAPWVREVERTPNPTKDATGPNLVPIQPNGGVDSRYRSHGDSLAGPAPKTLGWQTTCKCTPGHHENLGRGGNSGRLGTAVAPACVLDPFGGSGTTALVARKLGRKAILIELNSEYCELASSRLAQQSLFAVADD